MRLGILFCLIIVCGGCATSGARPVTSIDASDGINAEEAVLLARQSLIESGQTRRFHSKHPEILSGTMVEDYLDTWFVSFNPKDMDDHFWRYLVVLDKKSGTIIWADTYQPLRVFNYDWVFRQP